MDNDCEISDNNNDDVGQSSSLQSSIRYTTNQARHFEFRSDVEFTIYNSNLIILEDN